MENTKNYVVVKTGFEGLFDAMVTLAESDIASGKDKLVADAKQGINEWLTLLRKLDIADAIIE